MSNIIRLEAKYSVVCANADLDRLMQLSGHINQSSPDKFTGSFVDDNGERWVWSDADSDAPELTDEFIDKFINVYGGYIYSKHLLNYQYFVSMAYNRLFESVPSYIPNSIKTYSNLIDWNGNPDTIPEDKGEPIYKTWVEYFEGTNNQIWCSRDKSIGYVTSNLWYGLNIRPLFESLTADNYTIVTVEEYITLRDNDNIFDYLLTLEQIEEQIANKPIPRP